MADSPIRTASLGAENPSRIFEDVYLQEYWPQTPHNADMWADNLELLYAYRQAACEVLMREGRLLNALEISTGPCLAPLLATMECVDQVVLSDLAESSRRAILGQPIVYWRNYAEALCEMCSLPTTVEVMLARLDELRRQHPVLDVDLRRKPPFNVPLPKGFEPRLVTVHFVADSATSDKGEYFDLMLAALSQVKDNCYLLNSSLVDSSWWMLAGSRQPSPSVTEEELIEFMTAQGMEILSILRSRRKPGQTYEGGWSVILAKRCPCS